MSGVRPLYNLKIRDVIVNHFDCFLWAVELSGYPPAPISDYRLRVKTGKIRLMEDVRWKMLDVIFFPFILLSFLIFI